MSTDRSRFGLRAGRLSLVLALVAATGVLAGAADATVSSRSDYENGKYESSTGWDSLQYEYDRPMSDSFQVVPSTRKAGKAAKIIVRQGYSPFGYNESTEMARDFSDQGEGREYYYAWSQMYASDFRTPYGWGDVIQFYTQNWQKYGGPPPLMLDVGSGKVLLSILAGRYSNPARDDDDWRHWYKGDLIGYSFRRDYEILPSVYPGHWQDFVMRVRWSGTNGLIQVWHRLDKTGPLRKIFDQSGIPTLRYDANGGASDPIGMLKQRLYRKSYCEQPTDLNECDSNQGTQSTAVIYFDDFVRGTGFDEVVAGAFGESSPPPPDPPGEGSGLTGAYYNNSDLTSSAPIRVDPTLNFGWGAGSPHSSINPDTFSVRWTGALEAPTTARYTLITRTDDGVRLWLDGRLVIDDWNVHTETENSAAVDLVAGRRHALKIEYFERDLDAAAKLLWSSPTQARQIIPTANLHPVADANQAPTVALTRPQAGAAYPDAAQVELAANASDSDGSVSSVAFYAGTTLIATDTTAPYEATWTAPAGTHRLTARATDNGGASTTSAAVTITVGTPPPAPSGTGLTGAYFNNSDLTALKVTRVDRTLNFGWGRAAPHSSMGADTFSVRWTGALEAPTTARYTLITRTDDGVRLWLDGQLLIDDWKQRPEKENSAAVDLVAGRRHALKIEYFERDLDAAAKLLWASPTQTRQIIPAANLYPEAAPNEAPSVALTRPPAGATYPEPGAVELAANASDSDGSIRSVAFYAGTTLIATDTTAPYAATWTAPAGSHQLTAKATDSRGATTTSAAVSITVGTTSPPPSGTGLKGAYFHNSDLTSPALTRVDATINFGWGRAAPHSSINADTFSVRWTGALEAPTTARYTLITRTDDGVRLWLDGRLLIDDWNVQTESENSVAVDLVAGRRHALKIEYFERDLDAAAKLLWSSPMQARQIIPTANLHPEEPAPNQAPAVALTQPEAGATFDPGEVQLAADASDSDGSVSSVAFYAGTTLIATDTTAPYEATWTAPAGTYQLTAKATDDAGATTTSAPVTVTVAEPPPPTSGLTATYFDNESLTGAPALTRTDPTVEFDWGLGSPHPSIGPDSFSVRWTGTLEAPATGVYTLSLLSDDGVRVWLDGLLVIDNWVVQEATENLTVAALVAGRRYPIRIEYFDHDSRATAKLMWWTPGMPKDIVPESALHPAS